MKVKRFKKQLLAGGVVLLLLSIFIFSRLGGNTVQNVQQGQKVVITVVADEIEDMYGYQFQMNYDSDVFEYVGELSSNLDSIQTIFAKPFEGYQLVGATMIGESPGVGGSDVTVCQLAFVARQEAEISDVLLSISNVNIVRADGSYIEGVTDWSVSTSVAS